MIRPEFAEKVQAALHSATVKSNSRSKNRGVKKAPFVVLIGASMPSVLCEIGFVSNARDESLMKRRNTGRSWRRGYSTGFPSTRPR